MKKNERIRTDVPSLPYIVCVYPFGADIFAEQSEEESVYEELSEEESDIVPQRARASSEDIQKVLTLEDELQRAIEPGFEMVARTVVQQSTSVWSCPVRGFGRTSPSRPRILLD
jgi:hypothetical protein